MQEMEIPTQIAESEKSSRPRVTEFHEWAVTFEQDENEAVGFVLITAAAVAQIGLKTVMADGVRLEFHSEVFTVSRMLDNDEVTAERTQQVGEGGEPA